MCTGPPAGIDCYCVSCVSESGLWTLSICLSILSTNYCFSIMSEIPPPFGWSTRLQYNWYSVEGVQVEKLQRTVAPYLLYDSDPFQLKCTAHILNGQDVFCISASGSGKLALMYLVSIACKGTIYHVCLFTSSRHINCGTDTQNM